MLFEKVDDVIVDDVMNQFRKAVSTGINNNRVGRMERITRRVMALNAVRTADMNVERIRLRPFDRSTVPSATVAVAEEERSTASVVSSLMMNIGATKNVPTTRMAMTCLNFNRCSYMSCKTT